MCHFCFIAGVILPRPRLSDYLDIYDEAAEQIRQHTIMTEDGVVYHPGVVGQYYITTHTRTHAHTRTHTHTHTYTHIHTHTHTHTHTYTHMAT